MKKFYDVHMHAMDLSHANLTAFAGRLLQDLDLDLDRWEKIGTFRYFLHYIWRHLLEKISHWFTPKAKAAPKEKEKLPQKLKKIRNLLSFMESSIKYDFLILDFFLKNKEAIISSNNEFKINGTAYNKIVLCPLIMDFGYKSIYGQNYFYNIPPQKPVVDQIKDLFEAISTYYKNELTINKSVSPNKFDVNPCDFNPDNKLFEIYPFMGINTDNYELIDIEKMFAKYFFDFKGTDTPEERQQKLFNKMGQFKGDLSNEEDCRNIFVGIKLYPPLGFNPWPCNCYQHDKEKDTHTECANRQAKVELLYKMCIEKNIPIITHCGNGGFNAAQNADDITNPGTHWATVLKNYPGLKIDFAHFGAGVPEWRKTIVKHILNPGSKVYTDFSYGGLNDEYYRQLEVTINTSGNAGLLTERVLFGSDFMINLMSIESYNQYLKNFFNTNYLVSSKEKLCSENAERFLFG